ncbi:MAG: hypothetical protein QNL87_00740 [Gammaproteobacteria bacterium]|nr:hypothetical protein [Gammaproteobacteria bacterium]
MRLRLLLLVYLVAALVSGCSTLGTGRDVDGNVPLNKAVVEVPEGQLLDVWIELFDPGELPDDEEEAMGLSMDIREAEARYMPEQLRITMESTGYWGAVRVVPQNTEGSELLVRGVILVSNGDELELEITALDATGREWFSRNYEETIEVDAYQRRNSSGGDVFHSLYHTIANDLAEFRQSLTARDITAIRQVAKLRFAVDLSPEAFDGYLALDRKGRYSIVRLPAADDPMLGRVLAIRDRDFLLIDTLNGHFDNFSREMDSPYNDWRKARSDEAAALRKVKNDALKRKLLGVAAIIGAIVVESSNNGNYGSSVLRDSLILGGAYAIKSGFDIGAETDIHRDAIIELDESFSSEARPLVVEVEGEVHELTGSAEVQYAQWRALLKRIYAAETGFSGS